MPLSRRKFLLGAGAVALAAVPLTACAGEDSGSGARRARPVAGTGVSVVADDPSGVATSAVVFATADTAVVVAAGVARRHLEAGCSLARDHGVPVFADNGPAGDSGAAVTRGTGAARGVRGGPGWRDRDPGGPDDP